MGPRVLLAHVWRHLGPHRRKVWTIFALLLIDAGLSSGLPLGIKFLVDSAIVPRDLSRLVWIIAALGVATLIVSAAAIARDYLYALVGTAVMRDLRIALFHQLQRLSAAFHSRTQAGDVLARFSTDLAAVENTVSTVLPWGLMSVLTIVCSFGVLFYLQWQLALLTLVAIPLSLAGPHTLGPRAAAAGYRMKQHEAGVAGAVEESLAGQATVRAFGLEARGRAAFLDRLAGLSVHSRRFNFLSGPVQRTPNLAVGLVHIGVLGFAAFLAFRGDLSVGSLVSFDLVFFQFAGGVASLTEIAPSFLRAAGGLTRVEELLAEEASVLDPVEPRPLDGFSESIAFTHVSFGYDPDHPNLGDVSFEIRRGWHVAFVGRSGSGKSTILKLLLRFHDPDAGSVTIDGIDLRELRQSDIRARMALVSQDGFLFDTTIAENLRAVRPDATQAEIEAAARAAEAHAFIAESPLGFDTPVGPRGSRLSGGQRQRLAVARALLRDPAILLLDEATSALDAATEASLDRTLASVARDRTVIAVTHRLRSITEAHRIFVLEGGRLVEQGRHAELLGRDGVYAEIWRKQGGLEVGEDGVTASVTADRLRLIPLLEHLDPALLEEISLRFASEQVPADRLVLEEGDPGDRFYLVARGRAAVSRRDLGGEERTVAVLEKGDHFGEIALLRDGPRTATIRTLEPCLFLTLQRGAFLKLVERAPGLREALEAIEVRRVSEERNLQQATIVRRSPG